MKKIGPILVLIIAAYFGWDEFAPDGSTNRQTPARDLPTGKAPADLDLLTKAIDARRSDVQVEGEGVVVKVLPDDNKGSRHQRFLLEVARNKTVLVAHNIDLAKRIPKLRVGDTVRFNGEYEWNDKGGVIHWTHHDPQKRHVDGWLKHNGATFE